jgi:hypothetical protein
MALLANVALTNTFDTWRTRTNNLVTRLNQFAIDESKLYANTITANVRFVSAGSTRLGTTASNRTIINGLLTANGNLNVSGNTTISGNITVNGGINLGDATSDLLTVTGRATIGTNLTVSGNTTLGGASKTITMGGASSTLTIGGAGHTTNTSGWFGVAGRASVSTNLFVGGNTIIGSSGRLGIGTKTPSYPLVLAADQNSALVGQIINTNAGGSAQGILQVQVGASAYVNYATSPSYNQIIGTGAITTQYIDFDTQIFRTNTGTEVARFTNGGLKVAANTTLAGTTTDNSNARSQTLTDGATISWDTSLGRVATVTLGGNRTMAAPTNLKVGTYILHVIQDGTGSRTIAWNAVFKWVGAVAPVLSTTAARRDILSFVSDGTNLYGSFLPDVR